jgi:hypothetical protein
MSASTESSDASIFGLAWLFVPVSKQHSQCCWTRSSLASTQRQHLVKIRDYCNAILHLIVKVTVSRCWDLITSTDRCNSDPGLQIVNKTCFRSCSSQRNPNDTEILLFYGVWVKQLTDATAVIHTRFKAPRVTFTQWSLLACQYGVRIRRACTLYLHDLRYKCNMWGLHIIPLTKTKTKKKTNKLHGLSLRANYTDRATAACRQSDCQLLRIEGATWSAWRISTAVF